MNASIDRLLPCSVYALVYTLNGSLKEPWRPPQDATLAIERGKAIASQGIPRQRVPSCVDCHGPGVTRWNPIYPNLCRAVCRLPRVTARTLPKAAPWRFGIRPSYASGCRQADPRADARRGAVYYASLTSEPGRDQR